MSRDPLGPDFRDRPAWLFVCAFNAMFFYCIFRVVVLPFLIAVWRVLP